jgi:hypothetical protein
MICCDVNLLFDRKWISSDAAALFTPDLLLTCTTPLRPTMPNRDHLEGSGWIPPLLSIYL